MFRMPEDSKHLPPYTDITGLDIWCHDWVEGAVMVLVAGIIGLLYEIETGKDGQYLDIYHNLIYQLHQDDMHQA